MTVRDRIPSKASMKGRTFIPFTENAYYIGMATKIILRRARLSPAHLLPYTDNRKSRWFYA